MGPSRELATLDQLRVKWLRELAGTLSSLVGGWLDAFSVLAGQDARTLGPKGNSPLVSLELRFEQGHVVLEVYPSRC